MITRCRCWNRYETHTFLPLSDPHIGITSLAALSKRDGARFTKTELVYTSDS